MANFTDVFDLNKLQSEVDFVDIDLETDTPLYLCPYAIQIRQDEWSLLCGDHIRSFFSEVLDQLRADNNNRVEHLLSNLHEPNETHLGQSIGRPSGRGVGEDKASLLGHALRNSRAFATGMLSDVSEAELFIHGVGRDTISDLTTNVLRGLLSEYTYDQCVLHEVATTEVRTLGPVWNISTKNWEAREHRLPMHLGKPILLVPKFSVRHQLSLNSQEFYNFHMVEFLQSEYLEAGGALVQTLKNGDKRVTKISVKDRHPLIKDDLATFVRDHPEVLERYREIKGSKGPLTSDEFELGFDEPAFAEALITKLRDIPTGSDDATRYHHLSIGICTFLFYPHLITPVKEHEQHDGRKRVDIKFTNAAEEGFFHRVMSAPQTRALSIFIECKNYTRDVQNPELDQLSSRFNIRQGRFGILLCRSMSNREKIIAGCRDTALDDRGFMVPLEDADLIAMLESVRDGDRQSVDIQLGRIFDQISN